MGCFNYKDVEICLIGHASARISYKDVKMFIDPYAHLESDLYCKADYILITHEHFDHCSLDAIKKIYKDGCKIIIPKGSKCYELIKEVFNNADIMEISENEEISFEDIRIRAVPAYNVNKPYHPRGLGVGYVVWVNDVAVYHPGDTDFIPEMSNLKGKVDVMFVPISGVYVMDEYEAVEAVKAVMPKIAVPMHYNYLEGLEKDADKFAEMINGMCEVKILLSR